jgi:hypothetical protein
MIDSKKIILCVIFGIFIYIIIYLITPKYETFVIKDNLKNIRHIEFNEGTYNSSIIKNKEKDGYILFSRESNQTKCYGNYNFLKKNAMNNLVIKFLDSNFDKIKKNVINLNNLADVRSFYYNNNIYLIGTWLKNFNDFETNNNTCMCIIDPKFNITKLYIEGTKLFEKKEKNWMPIIINDKLFIVVEHNPLTIVEPNLLSGECKIIYKGKYNKNIPKLRGNTPYIHLGNNIYLGITHIAFNNLFSFFQKYLHYFTIIDMNTYKIKISKPICFLGNCGIEFVMGFIDDEQGNYIITFGKNDCTENIMIIPKNDVLSLFK